MSDKSGLLTQFAGLPPQVFEAQLTDTGVTLQVDEVTLRVSSDDSGWRVDKSWRGVDRGLVFEATDDADVAQYVLALFGNDIRRAHGLGRAVRKVVLSDDGVARPDGGFFLTEMSGDGYRLSRDRDGAQWFFASDLEAARFSTVADIPLAHIRDALRGTTRP